MPMKTVSINKGKQTVALVPRAQLRQRSGLPRLKLPAGRHAPGGALPIPTPPAAREWAATTVFPILGNDRYGDCFYACVCHNVQAWAGANGLSVTFDPAQVVKRYLELSGGDNGLDWGPVEQEFVGGIIGPNGPHQSLSLLGIDPNDVGAMTTAIDTFGPVQFTLAVPDVWIAQQSYPGAVWDATPRAAANPQNGHAVLLTGYDTTSYTVRTWGLEPPIRLTHKGVRICDPEAGVALGAEWFGPHGLSPSHHTYADTRSWWLSCGGDPLPDVLPGPDPTPDPSPAGSWGINLSGTMGGQAVSLSGTIAQVGALKRQAAAHLKAPDRMARFRAARPESITPEQWQLLLALLHQFFPDWFGAP